VRAAWYEKTGPAEEVLILGELPDPVPQPGEVLVRLRTSGINPSDVRRRSGDVPTQPFPQIVPHNDGAGEIVAVGAGVPDRRIGERVWLFKAQWQRPFGTAAELIALPAALAVPLPHGISWEAAAALGIPALTAWYCLACAGPLAGKRVLVTGGTGAVGQAAVQLARWAGAAMVAATAGSETKAGLAAGDGADPVVRHDRPGWGEALSRAVPDDFDLIVEVAVGSNIETTLALLGRGGTIVGYDSKDRQVVPLPFYALMRKLGSLRSVHAYAIDGAPEQEAVAALTAALAAGSLQPRIAQVLPLSEIVAAHRLVETGHPVGKVLLSLS